MKEIGGYFEMERNTGAEYHSGAIALNCGRRAISYLVQLRQYRKVYAPSFSCNSVYDGIEYSNAEVENYDVDEGFLPIIEKKILADEAVLIINYYGQLSRETVVDLKQKFGNIILDNSQAFFEKPIEDVDTIYNCRKFFGVPDGAYLFTDAKVNETLPMDVSVNRMKHVLGRFDVNASTYFNLSKENNDRFQFEPIKSMSKLTKNLLCGIDYNDVAYKRNQNAMCLHKELGNINRLSFHIPRGAFMYPLWGKRGMGALLRKHLQEHKIYVSCLWPDVLEREQCDSMAYQMADDILALPCDHRYCENDMEYIIKVLNLF